MELRDEETLYYILAHDPDDFECNKFKDKVFGRMKDMR